MRLHVLVEGASEEALLERWLPRLLPQHTFKIIPHRGKGRLPGDPSKRIDPRRQGLLDQLPAKLRAYGRALNSETDRVLVLVDLDSQDCMNLKQRLAALPDYCDPSPMVRFRIAIEETEAFYLGDKTAIKQAFPKAKLQKLAVYDQDSVCGTWELFQNTIGESSEDKVEWAKLMGAVLGTKWKGADANESVSFQHFCKAALLLAGELST